MRRITHTSLTLLTIQTHTYVGVPATSVWTFASAEIQQRTESWETLIPGIRNQWDIHTSACGVMEMIPAPQTIVPGSIPGWRKAF